MNSGIPVATLRKLPDGTWEHTHLRGGVPVASQILGRPARSWTVAKAPGGCGNTYTHTSGWMVQHCGHPTANYPYSVHDPEGRMHLAPSGMAWRLLKEAKAYVERQAAQEATR